MLLTAVFFFKGLMLIPCLYLQTCMNINEIKRKRCAIFIRLYKHFWPLVCLEQGSLQAPALAQAAQAGEADVLNCQEDLPACHPQDCFSSSPHNLKIHSMCMCVLAFLCVTNKFLAAFPLLFIFKSYHLSNFYFLCDRCYNLKMQMCGLC